MTAEAQRQGVPCLVLSESEWVKLVHQHMSGSDPMGFSQAIIPRVGSVASIDTLNQWIGLATAIWNATPQPDRGGKSANELLGPSSGRPRPRPRR